MRRFLLTSAAVFVIGAWGSDTPPPPPPVWHQTTIPVTVNASGGAGGAGGYAKQNQGQSQKSYNKNNVSNQVDVSTGSGSGWHGPIGNTPDLAPPSIATANPCLGGWSGGLVGPYGGIAAGGTVKDKDCQLKGKIIASYNMRAYDTAVALMCNDPEWADAIHASGGTCPKDPQPQTQVVNQTNQSNKVNNQKDQTVAYVGAPVFDLCKARPGWTEKEARAQAAKEGTPCP